VYRVPAVILHVTGLDDWPASDVHVWMGFVYTLYWQVATEQNAHIPMALAPGLQ